MPNQNRTDENRALRKRRSEATHSKTDVKHVPTGLTAAIEACRLRGARITPLREAVLTALWATDKPLGAYELRDQLESSAKRKLAAPSIYRSLEFLCDQGVATRIESCNGYVACAHPEEDHACVFLVCETCGDAVEIANQKIDHLIGKDAERHGFAVKRRVVEMSGVCAPCQQAL